MKRRDFIYRVALAPAAGAVLNGSGLQARPTAPADETAKLRRICISTWSFHNYFPATREKTFNLPGDMLKLVDFPKLMADKYKVHNIEICVPHFESAETGYLKVIKARLGEIGSKAVNMPVDIPELWEKGGLSDPDKRVRDKAIRGAQKWIDVAAAIECKSVRCDPGKMDPKNLAPTIESYKQLSEYGKKSGVHVVIENHGGLGSEHPEELVELFKGVGGSNIGALPDFANFPDEAIRVKGLQLLMPYAQVVCHAKGLEFDDRGNETKFDFPKCMEITKKANFKGVYSIEFEGPGDPYAGCGRVLANLLKYL